MIRIAVMIVGNLFWQFANEFLHFFLKFANLVNQTLHEFSALFIELAI